jgi:hypothetical protein
VLSASYRPLVAANPTASRVCRSLQPAPKAEWWTSAGRSGRRPARGTRPNRAVPSIRVTAQAATALEHAVPVTFWITIFLFVVVGFMLVNGTYWGNQRYEAHYRKKRFEQLKRERDQG